MKKKQLSVIIPNYNYAHFLQRRIDSVVNQTIKPDEIIFLDDCSTDNSLEIAKDVLSKTNIPYQIIPNEVNQGVFKQWLKGIQLAKYDYFWIAEADDYCELNFLETLLPNFDDPDVVISYCKSKFIDQFGNIICDENDYKSKYFDINHWQKNYINSQEHEIANYLSVINTIPNASAVIFNKSNIRQNKLKDSLNKFTRAGDWFFYIISLNSYPQNKIAYCNQLLNYYVRHDNSAYISNYTKSELFYELLSVYLYVLDNFELSLITKGNIFNQIYEWLVWYDFNLENQNIILIVEKRLSVGSFFQQVMYERNNFKDLILSLKSELNDARSELSDIINSRSWKLTKPLRLIFSIFRKK